MALYFLHSHLCGYPFASLPRILAIAQDAKAQQASQPVRVVHETPVSALLDGGNNVGYVTVYRATQVAIDKARAHQFAVVGVYNSYYSGRNAYYMEMIVKAGLVGMHLASAQPHVVPPGGTRPALGTNPRRCLKGVDVQQSISVSEARLLQHDRVL